ncbi:ArsR/SmtB family transcription factor [Paenibacillus sp. GCM10027627]|uniref:ArsR/SmtB family transcription factor n=1 Tax=unclassified Paenibacillus TaxID=185978 RepID=UPI00362C6133
MENEVFKALADPNRRKLLDLLHASDGRTLGELCLPLDMTRFGVMKHLNILEEAGLITTKKAGREKLHYLNAVPIRQIYDRWVSKYSEPWVMQLTSIQNELEREFAVENKPRHIHRIAIKATPEKVWQALTDPAQTSKFWFNCSIHSDWQEGSSFELVDLEGRKKAEGTLIEVDPPHKLIMRWTFHSFPGTENDSPSRIAWTIEPHGEFQGVTLLTVVHDEFEQAKATAQILENGLPIVLSGMKSLLETGISLTGN